MNKKIETYRSIKFLKSEPQMAVELHIDNIIKTYGFNLLMGVIRKKIKEMRVK